MSLLLFLFFVLYKPCHNLPFPPVSENGFNDDKTIGELLGYFKNFNASSLFDSFRLPVCVQDCANELSSTLASLNLDSRWSVEKTREACRQFEVMKKCLAEKPQCSSMIVDIGMHAFTYLCNDDETTKGLNLIPCIRREALKIHGICERACKFGAVLLDAATINSKNTVLNFLDEKGHKILSVPDLHRLCNSSTCFLSCMRAGIEGKCPNGGSAFVDNMLKSFVKKTTNGRIRPETSVVDAYASLVSSFLPRQCQYLFLEEKDIILTTPGAPFVFVTDAHKPIVTTTLTVENSSLISRSESFNTVTWAKLNTTKYTIDKADVKGDEGNVLQKSYSYVVAPRS
uniref:CPG4 domain-containing protein n=1 Tax=Syphacia muris TaxID=451379 RepID=A0A0N5AEB3_9BILA